MSRFDRIRRRILTRIGPGEELKIGDITAVINEGRHPQFHVGKYSVRNVLRGMVKLGEVEIIDDDHHVGYVWRVKAGQA